MRIVVCHPGPQFSVHDVYTGWVEALRGLGPHVIEFNLHERLSFYERAFFQVDQQTFRRALPRQQAIELATNGLYATLYKTRPEVLVGISGFFLTPELLDLVRWSRTKIVLIHTESPYEEARQLKIAAHADVNLVNDPTNLAQYQAVSTARYVPHSYREKLHRRARPVAELASDLAFVGTGYPSRVAFLEQMDLTGLDVLLAGYWRHLDPDSPLRKYVAHNPDECFDNTQAARVYRSAKVGLNLYRREAADENSDGWAMGPREVEMAACGLFFLREPRAEGDQVLNMLPTIRTPEEATEALRHYLNRDEKRRTLADAARRAIADRTFTRQAAELLRLLDRKSVTV